MFRPRCTAKNGPVDDQFCVMGVTRCLREDYTNQILTGERKEQLVRTNSVQLMRPRNALDWALGRAREQSGRLAQTRKTSAKGRPKDEGRKDRKHVLGA